MKKILVIIICLFAILITGCGNSEITIDKIKSDNSLIKDIANTNKRISIAIKGENLIHMGTNRYTKITRIICADRDTAHELSSNKRSKPKKGDVMLFLLVDAYTREQIFNATEGKTKANKKDTYFIVTDNLDAEYRNGCLILGMTNPEIEIK